MPEGRALPHLRALDGLRAVAVLLVVLFHFGLSWLPGGFLGVDMFFVLSGFLITSLLIREHSATGKLQLRLFWRGRARRLFPALGLLLVVVALVALSDGALEQLTVFQQGIATLLYVNNCWLIFTDTPYFNALQQPSPLLHTWSLGVEEQWYLIFPLLMVAALTMLARRARRSSGSVAGTEPGARAPLPFSRLGIGLGVLALCSTAWGAALAAGGASFDRLYFGTDVRAQELLVGSALACLYRSPDWGRRAATALSNSIGVAGVSIVALLALLASEASRWLFSGGMLALSMAVAAIIWSSAQAGSLLARPLSWRPMVYVGVISYGVYLWHWPLSVWLGENGRAFSGPETVAALLLSIAIASASYHLLERPIRRGTWGWESGRRGWAAALAVPVVLAGLLTVSTPQRSDAALASAVASNAGLVQPTSFVGSGPGVFIVGDSVVQNLSAAWPTAGVVGFGVASSFYLGCSLHPDHAGFEGEDVSVSNTEPCMEWYELWGRNVSTLNPELSLAFLSTGQYHHDIVTADGRVLKFGTPEYQARLEQVIDEVTRRLATGSKRVAWVDMTCNKLPYQTSFNRETNDYQRTAWVNQVLNSYVAQHPEVGLIPLSEWDCGWDQQTADRNAGARKFDGMHFTPEAAAEAWKYLAPRIEAELGKARGAADGSGPPLSTSGNVLNPAMTAPAPTPTRAP